MPRNPASIPLALALALLFAATLAASPAWAATFTVNSTADTEDATLDGACDTCTLREAIQEANFVSGADIINFAIPSSGVQTISPTSDLPTITDAVTIDGYTQGDGTADDATPNTLAVGNNAHLLIELNGTNAGLSSGLRITSANSTVRGLVINRFQEYGLNIDGPGTTIEGNYVGTGVSGTTDLGNSLDGVVLFDANNTIGGTTEGARNVISGNDGSGVTIRGTGNQLLGNYIGTDKNGTAALGNTSHGVLIDGGLGNWIGGTTEGARNVISGNGSAFAGSGVFIDGVGGNQVRGNYIGTDKNGTAALGNRFRGVVILDAANNTIGGTEAGAGNLISGNTLSGVFIQGTTSPGNRVQGNYIGTDKDGTTPLGNSSEGVNIDSGSGDTIGGTVAGARNVISANQGDGVFISGSGSQVQGNYIGTDKNGTRPAGAPDLGNSGSGVTIGSQGTNNTIGGTTEGARNAISDNNGSGVVISGNSNQVQGNYIGTNASRTAPLGNSSDGVTVSGTNNAILSNAIFSNGDLGIDLLPGGVSANDPGDPDLGANNLQNFPELTSAKTIRKTTIKGTLNSTPGTTFTVQLFINSGRDPSGNGEGRRLLGQRTVTTDANGNASFGLRTRRVSGYVTATATNDSTNDTSEFSAALKVTRIRR